jgi:hypothetical protein
MITNCTQLFWLLNGAPCRSEEEGAGSSLSRVPTELLTGTTAPGGGAPTLQTARQRGLWWWGLPAADSGLRGSQGSGDLREGNEWSELLAQETQRRTPVRKKRWQAAASRWKTTALRRARWRPWRRPDEDRWLCGASSPPTWTLWWATWDVWSEPGF